MSNEDRYLPLSPGALAAGFAVLGLLGGLGMGMPFMFGMGSMMSGSMMPGSAIWGFSSIVIVALAALSGAVVAWVYNAVIRARVARP